MTDASYYSDAEVDDRLSHNRSRSLTGNYVLYSPDSQGKNIVYIPRQDVFFPLKNHKHLLSCQPRVTVMSCFVYKVIRDL